MIFNNRPFSKKLKLFLFLPIALLGISCSNDDGTGGFVLPRTATADQSLVEADITVQNFMWKAMNFWYFWQAEVPNLADDAFALDSEGSRLYTEFLASEDNPTDFFNRQLLFNQDRFSFLAEDYETLTRSLAGISRSNGLEFGLVSLSDNNEIFGYVRYIVPNSNASTKDISRGDIFTGVDGQTLNNDNYTDLLFGENDTYTLNMADINGAVVTPNDREVTLTKQENLAENPVFLTRSFDISGEKIGYLMYNGFTNEYDEDLNNAMGELKSAGITNLVLDLRYNPGGSVNTARLLSSMVYGTNTSDLFLRARYNDRLQPLFNAGDLERNFTDKSSDGSALNRLNLNKVYILTSRSTASASELVINGLAPYVDVIQIGETTRGKNEFSVTMVDDPDHSGAPYVYSPERENKINPNNRWAIQPLIGRNENADGFSDYTSGLAPDIALTEDLTNLGVLGDLNEPLLARAIQDITGSTSKRSFSVKVPANVITSSKMFTPVKDNMYVDDVPKLDLSLLE
ncbi:S41 family peptidase [Ulvibacterium sp.]|uniref:S41 family peptidase n=1 Tax=Ulvibacterium sp. TaxID=2665914 RepID=UPI002605F816|nr:S41 family peptidase [Ulvibacterium sp.]